MNKQLRNNLNILLQDTLGTGQLSAEQRQRHLDRLRTRAIGEDIGKNGKQRRLLEAGAIIAAGLIVLIGVVLWSELRPTEDAAQAGVAIDELEALVAPLEPGEARSYTVTVNSDMRIDRGLLFDWEVEVRERRQPDGTSQVVRIARDPDGKEVARFTQSGDRWEWEQRGWVEAGTTSLGIIDMPEEIRISMVEPTTAVNLLHNPDAYTVVDSIIEDNQRIISFVQPDPAIRDWLAQQYGESVSVAVYELVADRQQTAFIRSHSYFITDDGEEVTLADMTVTDVKLSSLDEVDDTLLDFTSGSDDNLQYPAPQSAQLPESITIISHRQDTLSATEWLTLNLGDAGDVIEVTVTPSRGGYDPSLYTGSRQDFSGIQVTATDHGDVVWATDEEGNPVLALWDTGQFRFDMSVNAELDDPAAWSEEEIFALIEVLSLAREER